ncbi:MAG: hypothetical protein A2201_01460 [Alicyclobacillus sp. RIFOXYA1_FULL_53_8]|nr:MAG: hypothetical protein A2201_01460 [Alicyclobacillus sp. RIFOXYA1_FULL_53_8]
MKVGIVGCGFIGQKHMRGLLRLNDVQLIGVYDVLAGRMDDLVNEYQTNRTHTAQPVTAYTTYQEMLDSPTIDVIAVTTPSGLHSGIAMEALQAGKHVILEKPMTLSLQEARAILTLAAKVDKQVAVCHQKRFLPHLQFVRKVIESGSLGQLVYGGVSVFYNRDNAYYQSATWRGTWRHDGGVLLNQGIHDIDLLLWMMGKPDSVQGNIARLSHAIETEDTAAALLQMSNGALARIEVTVSAPRGASHERLDLVGTQGSIALSGKMLESVQAWHVPHTPHPQYQEVEPYEKLYADFYEAVQQHRQPLSDGQVGLQALETIFAVYESAHRGCVVRLPLVDFETAKMAGFFA